MKKLKYLLIIFSVLFAVMACNMFEGAVDKNTDEAQYYDLIQDLNDGNYDSVIAELEGRSLDRDEKIILAKAYLGKGGVNFIEALRSFDDYPGDPYAAFTSMLGSESLTREELETRKEYFYKVYNLLGFVAEDRITYTNRLSFSITPTLNCSLDDKDFILISTIAATVDSSLSIANIVDDFIDNSTSDSDSIDSGDSSSLEDNASEDNVDILKDAIKAKLIAVLIERYGDDYENKKVEILEDLKEKINDNTLDRLKAIIRLIVCGGDVLVGNDDFEDLKNQFDDFVEQITDDNGEITKDSVSEYITDKIAELD